MSRHSAVSVSDMGAFMRRSTTLVVTATLTTWLFLGSTLVCMPAYWFGALDMFVTTLCVCGLYKPFGGLYNKTVARRGSGWLRGVSEFARQVGRLEPVVTLCAGKCSMLGDPPSDETVAAVSPRSPRADTQEKTMSDTPPV